MKLTERIQVKYSPELSNICHLAKNLYNQANYLVRQRYFFLCEPKRLDYRWLKELKCKLYLEPSQFDTIASITQKFLNIRKKQVKKSNEFHGKQGYGGIGKTLNYDELWNIIKYCPAYKAMPPQSAQQR